MQRIQRDIEGRDYKESLSSLQKAVRDTQADLMSSLPKSMSASESALSFFLLLALVYSEGPDAIYEA